MRASGSNHTLLTRQFAITAPPSMPVRAKRPAPFSIRLSADEKARLIDEAGTKPLGTHIREKLLGTSEPIRVRRTGATIRDREAHAKALALLGSSRLSENLTQLTALANIGSLPLTPEIEGELRAALEDVRKIRRLLVLALGLKDGGAR